MLQITVTSHMSLYFVCQHFAILFAISVTCPNYLLCQAVHAFNVKNCTFVKSVMVTPREVSSGQS